MVQDDGSSSLTSPAMSLSPPPPPPPPPQPLPPFAAAPPAWLRELNSDERGLCLVHLLLNCAHHVAAGSLERANAFLEQISVLSAPDGDAMQRIANHFSEALARRLLRSWPGLYRALEPSPNTAARLAESAAARRHFLDLCPFLRLAYLVTNQAILEAMEGEKVVHIIDLNAGDPTQWLSLLQGLSVRPEGPPHLRITGVHHHRELLSHTALRLTEEAERLDIPFQFNPVISRLDALDADRLRVKTGEALAISSVLQLHTMLANSDNADSSYTRPLAFMKEQQEPAKIESLLTLLWKLNPKMMVITEQESSHNGRSLNERFMQALFYYAALFDCLDSTIGKQSVERLRLEKTLFGEEIKNIIACEGQERTERHEKLERWTQRMEAVGFGRGALSYIALMQARRLLQQSFRCEGYSVAEDGGCFNLCWQGRPLFSVSAWRCKRFQ